MIFSCNDSTRSNENINNHNFSTYILQEEVHPEDTITLYYDNNLNKSRFNDINEFYATIEVYEKFKTYLQRVKLEKEKNKIFSSKYIIPSNAILLNIKISPRNVVKTNEILSVVTVDKNNNPQKYAIPLFLSINSNFDENTIKELLALDEELFPMNYQRLGVIWSNNFESLKYENKVEITDSIFNVIYKGINKYDKEEMIIGLSICAYSYSNIGDKEKTYQCLSMLFDELNKSKTNIPHYLFNNLNNVKNMLVIYSKSSDNIYIYNFSKEINRKIFAKLLEIAELTDNISFDERLISPLDSSVISSYNSIYDDYLNHLYHKYSKLNKFDNASDIHDISHIYLKLSKLLKYRKQFSKATEIVEFGINQLEKVCQNDYWDFRINNQVLTSSLDGILGVAFLTAYNISMENMDTIKAVSYLEDYIKKYEYKINDFFSQGALSLASNYLTQTYIKMEEIEKSKKYLNKTFEFKSPFATDKFYDLNELLKTKGLNLLKLNDFKKLRKVENVNLSWIKTKQEKFNFNEMKDTMLVFFFLDDKCSSCNIGMSQAFDYIISQKKPIKIILVTESNLDELKKNYGNIFLVIDNTDKAIKYFKIKHLPYIIVILKNNIIHRVENIPNRQIAYEYFFSDTN